MKKKIKYQPTASPFGTHSEESLQVKMGAHGLEKKTWKSDCLHHAFYEDILRFIEKEREQVRERETQVEGDGNRSE